MRKINFFELSLFPLLSGALFRNRLQLRCIDTVIVFGLTSILTVLPRIQEGQLSVTGESVCTKYWLIAKEVQACPGKVWLG